MRTLCENGESAWQKSATGPQAASVAQPQATPPGLRRASEPSNGTKQ